MDFTLGRPRITVTFVDSGDSRAGSLALADRAAQLADLGLRVRAELWLSRKNIAAWKEWAESWLTISRSGGVDFVRPRARLPDANATLELLPPPSEVSQFLADVYASRWHDLCKTEPFASLLQALTCGTRSQARCGAANIMVIDSNGRPHKCEHGLGPARPGELQPCDCSWSALCDVVCAPCPALRRLVGRAEWRRWERLFCPAVQVLVPRMFAELATAARYQRALVSRQAGQRLRINAHAGQTRIWGDTVTTAHRTPLGGEHGNPDRPGRVGHEAPPVAVEGGRPTDA